MCIYICVYMYIYIYGGMSRVRGEGMRVLAYEGTRKVRGRYECTEFAVLARLQDDIRN